MANFKTMFQKARPRRAAALAGGALVGGIKAPSTALPPGSPPRGVVNRLRGAIKRARGVTQAISPLMRNLAVPGAAAGMGVLNRVKRHTGKLKKIPMRTSMPVKAPTSLPPRRATRPVSRRTRATQAFSRDLAKRPGRFRGLAGIKSFFGR